MGIETILPVLEHLLLHLKVSKVISPVICHTIPFLTLIFRDLIHDVLFVTLIGVVTLIHVVLLAHKIHPITLVEDVYCFLVGCGLHEVFVLLFGVMLCDVLEGNLSANEIAFIVVQVHQIVD